MLRRRAKLSTERKPSANLLQSPHTFNCHLWTQHRSTQCIWFCGCVHCPVLPFPKARGFPCTPSFCTGTSAPECEGARAGETTGRERLRPREGSKALALGEGQVAHYHTTNKFKGSGPQEARCVCAFEAGKMLQFKNKQSCNLVHKAS